MGKITVEFCEIEGLKIITPAVFEDARGYFYETYHYEAYKEAGIGDVFVQDNQSSSKRGVLRGLHFQIHHPQAKLVRVIKGEVFDVAVDIRPGPPHTDAGTERFYLRKTRNSITFPQILRTVSWFSPRMRNSAINVRISTTRETREAFCTGILRSASSGPSRREWRSSFPKKIPSGEGWTA